MDLTSVLAIYAAAVSTVVLLVQLAEFLRNGDDLRLSISTGIPTGTVSAQLGTNHFVQVTVASRGGRPVGVSGLVLRLNNGSTVPMIIHLPTNGSVVLPAILERGQFAAYYVDRNALRDQLRQSGLRIERVVANLTDGTSVTRRAPADWRRLGEASE